MKKARTLLAIWLALILTLTLFPTALAEPTTDVAEPFTATYTASEGITFNSNPTTVEPNASLEVTFTVADGYELKDVTIAMGETSNYNEAQLSQSEQTYTYTIPSVTGNVTFIVTAEKTATPSFRQCPITQTLRLRFRLESVNSLTDWRRKT